MVNAMATIMNRAACAIRRGAVQVTASATGGLMGRTMEPAKNYFDGDHSLVGAHVATFVSSAGQPASPASSALETPGLFTRYGSPVPQTHTHSSLVNSMASTKVTVLDSGLRVATEKVPHANSATVGVWIDAGSRFETDETNGTAHFLEHLAFKGTPVRYCD